MVSDCESPNHSSCPLGLTNNDPSSNVKDILESAMKRQDDLRDSEGQHLRDLSALRADHARDLREHARELRVAESDRLNAIRLVDVAAVQEANRNAIAQAVLLQNQVDTVAEAMRKQVETTAQAAATSLAAALVPIQTDIVEFRRFLYQEQGQKLSATDPIVMTLADIQHKLSEQHGAEKEQVDSGAALIAARASNIARNAVIISAASPFVVLLVATLTHGKF